MAKLNDKPKMPTRARGLTAKEWEICTSLFLASNLPTRNDVLITNGAGEDGRQFTMPNVKELGSPVMGGLVGLIPARVMDVLIGGLGTALSANGYIIHMGPDFYDDLTATDSGDQEADASATLCHEMTHVWQGWNSSVAVSYAGGSLVNQYRYGGDAYNYRPLRDWKSYNPEAQAKLVEDWHYAGRSDSDSLFPYIRDYLRRGIT